MYQDNVEVIGAQNFEAVFETGAGRLPGIVENGFALDIALPDLRGKDPVLAMTGE